MLFWSPVSEIPGHCSLQADRRRTVGKGERDAQPEAPASV